MRTIPAGRGPRRASLAAFAPIWCGLLLLGMGLGGCASGLVPIQQTFRAGNYHAAAAQIERYADRHAGGTPQTVIAFIEMGSMLRVVGDFEGSDAAFAAAEARIAELDARPERSASEELEALLRTPDRITYQGFDYDRQFVAVYRALNAMAMGDFEAPRQHFLRADRWQTFAIERNAHRIQRAEEQQAAARERVPTFDQTMQDPRLQAASVERFGDLSRFESYEGFANPYADLLRAVYLLGVAESGGDFDVARNLLRRVAGMTPGNAYVMQDLDLADRLASGSAQRPSLTYVFFETGLAPHREQVRISVPVFLVSNRVQIVPVAVPFLAFNPEFAPVLRVRTPLTVHDTSLLADVDRIVAAEFYERLTGLITRMVVAAAVKVGVQFTANEAVRGQNEWVRIGVMLSGAIWAAATNEADLRTWATLPKQIQYARVDTPGTGSLTLQLPGGPVSVPVEAEGINIVLVRSIRPSVPPTVSSFALGRAGRSVAGVGEGDPEGVAGLVPGGQE